MEGRIDRLLLERSNPCPRPFLNLILLKPTALVLKLKLELEAADKVAGFIITADWSSNLANPALYKMEFLDPNCIQL
jgi:hypothetical protein